MKQPSLRPAALAFDAIATTFDSRFGAWASVAAQRRAVRSALLHHLPPAGRILEIGGGTGEDANFMAKRGFEVLMTDPSPAMVEIATRKLAPLGSSAAIVAGEDLEDFAQRYLATGHPPFDGAFSNFAALNCVADLCPVAEGLARLLRPGATATLVLFGTLCPGEIIVETLHGRSQQAFRRRKRGKVPARLAGRKFEVIYHRQAEVTRTFAPWFVLERRIGIGVAVPPSAAEPWISDHRRLLDAMEWFDRLFATPFAVFGDHILYQFRRRSQ